MIRTESICILFIAQIPGDVLGSPVMSQDIIIVKTKVVGAHVCSMALGIQVVRVGTYGVLVLELVDKGVRHLSEK